MRERLEKLIVAFGYFKRIMKILASAGKGYLVLIVLFAIFFGALPGVSILVMQAIMNALQTADRGFEFMVGLIAIYIGIDLLSAALNLALGYIENAVQMKSSITLNMSVLQKVENLSLKDYENSDTYNLIQRAVNTNIGQLFSFFKSFVTIFQSLINLIMFSLILLAWRWWMLPVVLIMPVISAIVTAHYGKKQFLIQKNRTGEDRKKWYYQYLLTNDIAFKEIKVFKLGDYFRNKYKFLSLEFLKQDRKLLNQRTGAMSLLSLFDQAISAILFVYVILQAFAMNILLGDLITYTRSISNVKSSSQGFLAQIKSIYQSTLYISMYFDFIDMNTNTDRQIDSQSLSDIPYIELKNLSYKYKTQSDFAIKNINLRIDAGSLVAFIGQNGSGKTTLVKILSTLYDDYQGDVYFGKNNLRDINADEARKKIGILFQDFVKYELSAKENVALGQLEKIDDSDEIFKALEKTNMHSKVNDLDTQLGFWFEGGTQLSGGEWLRIALSRAFIRNAELYLLDEPNSALDSISERQILESFKELTKGKIGILVSHRIASIKNIADKIIVFDGGEIQATGTHEELLKVSNTYRELYEQESGMN